MLRGRETIRHGRERGKHILKYVLSSLEDKGSLNLTSMPVHRLFESVCLEPCPDGEATLVSIVDPCILSHADATMPQQKSSVMESPHGVLA